MNINALTVLLQELAYQSFSKISPAAKAEKVSHVKDSNTSGIKAAIAAEISPATGQPSRVETKQAEEQAFQPPAFAPIPLRSELFREARFFARTDGGKAGKTGKAGEEPDGEIFACLITENLGTVWVCLTCKKNFLSVKYFTDQEASNRILKENFSPMREELKEIGFTEVSITSQTKAELGAIVEGLLPKFELHLLDRKI